MHSLLGPLKKFNNLILQLLQFIAAVDFLFYYKTLQLSVLIRSHCSAQLPVHTSLQPSEHNRSALISTTIY